MSPPPIVVQRKVRISREAIVLGIEEGVRDEASKLAVKRAKVHVPVRTGKLKRSLQRFGKNRAVGSRVRYSGFVEHGTIYMTARHYLLKAIRDVERAMAGIVKDVSSRIRR